jgi:hypothetical protein
MELDSFSAASKHLNRNRASAPAHFALQLPCLYPSANKNGASPIGPAPPFVNPLLSEYQTGGGKPATFCEFISPSK